MTRVERLRRALLVVLLLVAFLLRVADLERRPLWWDEGNNVYFANQSLSGLLAEARATHDTDPPVHRLALRAWCALAGCSPFAVRFLSAWLGTLAVALTWTIARWLTGWPMAMWSGLFVALSPMQVHYAREAKGYPLVLVAALLATYAWGRCLGYADRDVDGRTPARSRAARCLWWGVYILTLTVALGTHYYVAPLLLWQAGWSVGRALAWRRSSTSRARRWRPLLRHAVAFLAVGGLVAVWVVLTYATTVRGVVGLSTHTPLAIGDYLVDLGTSFTYRSGLAGPLAALVVLCFVALAVAGSLTLRRSFFVVTWVAVPVMASFVLQAAYSFFSPRFLLYVGPPLYVLIGGGCRAVGRWLRRFRWVSVWAWGAQVMLPLLLVASFMPGLWGTVRGDVNATGDPRPLYRELAALAQPGDGLVYTYIWQIGYLESYDPSSPLTPYRAHFTPQGVDEDLGVILEQHPRVWLMNYRIGIQNNENVPASWLEANAYRAFRRWAGNHQLVLYLAPDFEQPGVGPVRRHARFAEDDGIGVVLDYPVVDGRRSPGDVLALPLRWRALDDLERSYHVFVHVGRAGQPPLSQSDGVPRNGLAPTSEWIVGETVLDRQAVLLPLEMDVGIYQVRVGLYDPDTGHRLPLVGGDGRDALDLGRLEVLD